MSNKQPYLKKRPISKKRNEDIAAFFDSEEPKQKADYSLLDEIDEKDLRRLDSEHDIYKDPLIKKDAMLTEHQYKSMESLMDEAETKQLERKNKLKIVLAKDAIELPIDHIHTEMRIPPALPSSSGRPNTRGMDHPLLMQLLDDEPIYYSLMIELAPLIQLEYPLSELLSRTYKHTFMKPVSLHVGKTITIITPLTRILSLYVAVELQLVNTVVPKGKLDAFKEWTKSNEPVHKPWTVLKEFEIEQVRNARTKLTNFYFFCCPCLSKAVRAQTK